MHDDSCICKFTIEKFFTNSTCIQGDHTEKMYRFQKIYSANHWSNETTMIAYLNHIITSYLNTKCTELGLYQGCPTSAIFDVFKGQCTENVFRLLEENNILYIIIPSN